MSSFTDYTEAAVLNHLFRATPLTSPTNVYLALYTVAPTDSTSGTEVSTSNTGYSRQVITFAAPSGGSIASNATVSFTNVGSSNFGTVVAAAICDASSAGNILAYGSFTPAAIAVSDTLTFNSGEVTAALT
jgi:hypothetical protein